MSKIQKQIEKDYEIENTEAKPYKIGFISPHSQVSVLDPKTKKKAKKEIPAVVHRQQIAQSIVADAFTVEKSLLSEFKKWVGDRGLHKDQRPLAIQRYMEASKQLHDGSSKHEKQAFIEGVKAVIVKGASFRFLQGVYKEYRKLKDSSTYGTDDKGKRVQLDFKGYILANDDYDINYVMQSRYMKVADYSAELVALYEKAYSLQEGDTDATKPFLVARGDTEIVVKITTDEEYSQMDDKAKNIDGLHFRLSELSPTITGMNRVASRLKGLFKGTESTDDILDELFGGKVVAVGEKVVTREKVESALNTLADNVITAEETRKEQFKEYEKFKLSAEKAVSNENGMRRILKKARNLVARDKTITAESLGDKDYKALKAYLK